MQKKSVEKVFFENIGGSFQFRARNAADLKKILSLDATAWAALCVPASSLNGDPAFFNALDNDSNRMIQTGEVKSAIAWMLNILADTSSIDNGCDSISVNAINTASPEGASLSEFIAACRGDLDNGSDTITLAAVRAKLAAVTAGALAGNGILNAKAVTDADAANLYKDITTLLNTPDQLTLPALEKFLADAQSFVDWSKTAEKPLYNGDAPEKYYDLFQKLSGKIDEYFRFSRLLCIDSAHAARFELDPAKLPELDISDYAKIDTLLDSAPLARPSTDMVLDLNAVSNPVYQKSASDFAALFNIRELTPEIWQDLKASFTDYANYLNRAQGDLAGKLGVEKLEHYLKQTEADTLRKLFTQDRELAGVVDNLRKLERLLLFSRDMLTFVNNFVSFSEFFSQEQRSMLQAGRLVMDGKSYNLAVWIDDPAAHKKIAVRSNLCLLYLEVVACDNPADKRKAAVAVTGGSLDRIYVGKPAYFIDNSSRSYVGKIIDMVEGPISFSQTLFAPFRRLSAAISGKIQKLTDFSATEKQLAQSIESGNLQAAPAAPAAPQKPSFVQKLGGNGMMMLLAGGLSLAAIGAGLSFIFKSIVSAVVAISLMPWYLIFSWIAVFAGIILIPMAIFAAIRLHKRNLTMFLEAGGWGINLPMRLNICVSRLFTRGTRYPEHSRFAVVKKPARRIITLIILALLLTAVLCGVYCFVNLDCRIFTCGR